MPDSARERRERTARLLEQALALPRESRADFVHRNCHGDHVLAHDVASLLDAHEHAGEYLDDLARRIVSPLLDGAEPDDARADDLPQRLQNALGDGYTLERELTGGGMSRVFVVADAALQRRIVAKVLPREAVRDVSAERFRREIRLSAQLLHPHIIPVLNASADDELLFYTMPYVAGETLRARIAQHGPLGVRDAVAIWRDVLEALACAHANGIIHRDIKPGNILLGPDGRDARVADFGIAHAVVAGSEAQVPQVLSVGTPAYMAPEQLSGNAPVDARTDLYAAGLVMCEMLTGSSPFANRSIPNSPGASGAATLASVRRADVPRALTALIAACISTDPEKRPQRAVDVLARLENIGELRGPGGRLRRYMTAAVAVVLVVVLAYGVAGYRATRHHVVGAPVAADVRPSLAVLPLQALASDPASDDFGNLLTAALIEQFTQTGQLRVIQGSSAFFFKGHHSRTSAVADSLGVANILSGVVQRDGNAVRVMLRLVRGADESVIWTHTYRSRPGNLALLTDTIGLSVTRELLPGLATAQLRQHRRAPDPQAYELYQRGRYYQADLEQTRTLRGAIDLYSSAIRRDSGFARAYAAMAEEYGVLATGQVSDFPARVAIDSARYYAGRAIALDASIPEAYEARAFVRMLYDFDWSGVDADTRKGIDLDPNYTRRLYVDGIMEEWRGHFARGVALLRADVTADPMSSNARQEYGRALFFNGDYQRAIAQLDTARVLEGGRDRPRRHLTLGEIYLDQGQYAQAETQFRHVLDATPEAPAPRAYLAITYARSGDRARAAAARADLEARWKARRSSAIWVALAYSALPQHDRAFAWLDSAYKDRSLRPLLMDPTFADLRRDPRFHALMRRIGLDG